MAVLFFFLLTQKNGISSGMWCMCRCCLSITKRLRTFKAFFLITAMSLFSVFHYSTVITLVMKTRSTWVNTSPRSSDQLKKFICGHEVQYPQLLQQLVRFHVDYTSKSADCFFYVEWVGTAIAWSPNGKVSSAVYWAF